MTDLELEVSKQDLKDNLILLKQDVKTLEQLIQYIESHIDEVAEEDVEDFDKNVTEFKNRLEIVDLW
jgi:HSP90 family molecular chaperone